MVSSEIPFFIFESFFKKSIRVKLNCERLINEKVTVGLSVFDELENPSAWYLPLYFNDIDEEVS